MINNIEGQNKAELIKIIEEQQAHDVEREARVKQLEWSLKTLDDYLSNKKQFAIEQQIKGVTRFVENFNNEYGGGFGDALDEYSDVFCEQLRKGGDV
ncbi:hypothetical protein [Alteromonas sp. BMJM2]|uniref:hypothetical protein n=1 Tax=Alteromonas sp. BMJM2 TaxID=2954241 RepID=UPI0022B34B4F|nr:hypothetical protein [Alteromonas sp. BMJM2]